MSASIGPEGLAKLLGDGWRRARGSSDGIADSLRALVVDGRVAPRTRIPSERALGERLGVSRGTVSRAYDRLREQGYLISARGAGSRLTIPGGQAVGLPAGEPLGGVDLSVAALPAPARLLGEALERSAAQLPRHAAASGYAAAGLPELREAVATRFAQRGVPTSADEILITSGAQHALHLVLGLLAAPGERVLVDAPTYPRTLSALRAHRLRAVAVPLERSGWDAVAWQTAVSAAAPRLALTIPDFHNPTGLTMAPADREALAQAAARTGTVLVADETMAELRLGGPPVPPPLAAFGRSVVTLGTMSKSAWGGLRVGWIRATPRLIRELAAHRVDLDLAGPVLEQLVAVELLSRWDEVLASRRELLIERRAALLDALARHAPEWTFRRPAGGLSVWARLPAPVATSVAASAARERILVAPGPSFSPDGAFEHHLRLPYTLPAEQLGGAIEALAAVTRRVGTTAGPVAPVAAVV